MAPYRFRYGVSRWFDLDSPEGASGGPLLLKAAPALSTDLDGRAVFR